MKQEENKNVLRPEVQKKTTAVSCGHSALVEGGPVARLTKLLLLPTSLASKQSTCLICSTRLGTVMLPTTITPASTCCRSVMGDARLDSVPWSSHPLLVTIRAAL